MKKVYTKPEITFESFTLSVNLAAGCEKEPNSQMYSCGIYYEGVGNVFLVDYTGCKDEQVIDGATNDGLCYHVPGGYNVFNS